MTIETKIATNGVKLYYVDGKRTSREVALQAAADNRENLFTIEYATRHNAYFTGRILDATQVYESTSKAVLKELELKIDEYHGFTVQLHTIGWVEICKLFNKDYAKSLINKIENAFIRGEYGVKIDKHGKVSILSAPVVEPEPDDYAVNPDAFDIAVNAEIQAANNVKINDLKWEIRYTEGSINDLDKNHIAHAPNDQSLKERRTELVNELDNLNAQLAELLPNEILQTEKMVSSEPATEPEVDPIITGIKEEQPMTIEIPAEGTHEFTIGDDTVCFFNGKFHSVFSAKYHMAIVRDLVGCFSYCIYNDGDTEVFNVREHAVSYDNFMETLHQRGNREKLLALRKEYIITDRLSENNSSMWYVNGKRSSQVKVWNLLQSYGLTLAEFLAEEEAYINERVAASCKKIAIKKQADFLADKIKRECASIDDSTTDRDEVFNLLPDLDNDVEKVWLTKGELDDLTAKFRAAVSIIPVTTRFEKMLPVTITITKQDKTKTFDMGFGAFAKYSIVQWQNGLRIMRNFSTLGIYDTPAQIEKVIDLLKAAITRGDKAFTFPTVDELIDPPELPSAKPRTLRNSINRAIKQCIRNRIGYLKSHNSKMEKYEYELLCLLQGARRELEVA